MNKMQFIRELDGLLAGIPEIERDDILYDYDSHIQSAMKNGKSEEEAVADLGSPQAIAADILGTGLIDNEIHLHKEEETAKKQKSGGGILAFIGLLLLNLIFIIGPVVGIAGALLGFYTASIACLLTPLALIINSFTHDTPWMLAFFTVLTTFCFGYLFFALTHFLAKGFIRLLHWYWKLNVRIVKGEK